MATDKKDFRVKLSLIFILVDKINRQRYLHEEHAHSPAYVFCRQK